MRVWLNYLWDSLRDRLWFIPSLFSLSGLVLAIVALSLDHQLETEAEWMPSALRTTGSAARTVLGALIGGLVTVAGLVFSLTMLSVSQTASLYGPRLIRNVFDRSVTQNTLGLFLGTIVYTMLVLRSIRDLASGEDLFTPNVSILLAELAGAACVFSLLAFTNHVARCMRAETLIESIFEDLKRTADRLYPHPAEEATDVELRPPRDWKPIAGACKLRTQQVGYLQAIDLTTLLHIAEENHLRIEILCRPGDFIHGHSVLALIETPEDRQSADPQAGLVASSQTSAGENSSREDQGCDDPGCDDCSRRGGGHEDEEWSQVCGRLQSVFMIGLVRTPRQDIEAGLMELVEAGVRALSPGVNDPITAMNTIDYLSAIVSDLARRTWPESVIADKSEQPRIFSPTHQFRDILNTSFNQLRQYSTDSVAVQCRLLEGLRVVAESTTEPHDRAAVREHAEMVMRKAEACIDEPNDLADVRRRYEKVLVKLK